MTVSELAISMLPEKDHNSFDCALPQYWVDEMISYINFDPVGHFVWLYDDSVFGRPFALDKDAKDALKKYNKRFCAEYRID